MPLHCSRAALLAPLLLALPWQANAQTSPRVEVALPRDKASAPLDGRLLLLVSTDSTREPRFQISDGPETQLIFGTDVERWMPGSSRQVTEQADAYPLQSLRDLPSGRYWVQALLNRYETFSLSTGHTVKLPPDKGEGQQWARKPGNLYSTPRWITLGAQQGTMPTVSLSNEIPAITPPTDTKWIKHITIRSERLSKFWGRDMYIGANVLLPAGFDEHPDARFPLVVYHGHFPATFEGFREEPPDPNLTPDFSARFNLAGYNRIQQELHHQFYKDWTSPDFPRVLLMEVRHATPYYDDSYAVNSASQGPWGDAIMYELIPEVERRFRGIGEGWARVTYGGSTGGWEAMAVQMFYPDEFNGAYVACPDPIDFRANTVFNLYDDNNAYYVDGRWLRTPRPGRRNYLGQVQTTIADANRREAALGSKGRSGDQWDIWQATYSPMGDDGYPKPIWDKATGVIDKEVAAYWRENYDLSHILRRDWATLGPKLHDKLNIYVGDMDNYYLNNAVYLVEDFLEGTSNPKWTGEITYGDRAEHCWNGDATRSNAYSRLRYHQMYIPRILDRMRARAPSGADTLSWRYSAQPSTQPSTHNTLSAAERQAGWKLLFDGASLDAWRGYQQADLPEGWTAIDGIMTKTRVTNDIVTREQFDNFELMLDWKLPLRGNSGIFYRATEKESKVYWSAPEYQLAEDSLTPDSRNIMTSVAAVHSFYPSKRGVARPAGEWNTTRIVANGAHVEHWLNGQLIAEYELWSPEWLRKLHGDPADPESKPLKFAPYKDFGMAKRGHIAIQGDHNGVLEMRNIKIRALK